MSAGGTVALRSRVGGALAKKRTKIALSGAIGIGVAALAAGPAGAQELSDVELLGTQVNLLWVVIGAVLVIFMQAGFALVETGFCRAKHAAHVVSTNFAIFGLGFVAFFLVGYPLMFGGYTVPLVGYDVPVGKNLIGSGNWVFLWQGGWGGSGKAFYTAGAMGIFLYMVAFMDTVATIPTGAMAERWKWKAFVGWGLFCGAIYYPLFGAWTWGGGWLAKLGESANLGVGYVDFAGSGVVHAVGGVAGLAGAIVLGPRIGKYAKDGTPRALPGHHIPMAMLGTFILLFGWFGFNAASTFAVTDTRFAVVALNTALAAAFGAVANMFWLMYTGNKKPDPGMMCQRHARRPGGHHGALRLRAAVGSHGHRHHRRHPRHLRLQLLREAGRRRPGRCDQRPRRLRHLRGTGGGHLRRRPVRRRLERHHHDRPRASPASSTGATASSSSSCSSSRWR